LSLAAIAHGRRATRRDGIASDRAVAAPGGRIA